MTLITTQLLQLHIKGHPGSLKEITD